MFAKETEKIVTFEEGKGFQVSFYWKFSSGRFMAIFSDNFSLDWLFSLLFTNPFLGYCRYLQNLIKISLPKDIHLTIKL